MLEQIKKQEAEAEERKQAREAVKKFAPLKLNPGKVPTESKAALLRSTDSDAH